MHVWLSRNCSATQGPQTQGPSTAAHPNHPHFRGELPTGIIHHEIHQDSPLINGE